MASSEPKSLKQSAFSFKGGAVGLKPDGIALNPKCKPNVMTGQATVVIKGLSPGALYQLQFTAKDQLWNAEKGVHVLLTVDSKQTDVRKFKSSKAITWYDTHFVASGAVVTLAFSGSWKSCFQIHDVSYNQCKAVAGGCKKSCQGFNCDYWADEEDYTCDVLEKDYGCNCAGCKCPMDKQVCEKNKCNGKSCDQWVELGRSCDFLIKNYKCSCAMCQCKKPKPVVSCIIITGVFNDAFRPNSGIELYTICDVKDLSLYGLGSANNGGGTDGEEYQFPKKTLKKDTFFYVATSANNFEAFTAFKPDFQWK